MGEYRVYLLSNVGDLHWSHLDSEYGIASVGHGAIASFRVGAVKPSAAIYREAERVSTWIPRRPCSLTISRAT